MGRESWTVRVSKLSEQGKEDDLKALTSGERIEMMWQLALDAWAAKGEPVVEPELPRHIVRVIRRKPRNQNQDGGA